MIKKIEFILILSVLILVGWCTCSQARITTSDPTVSSGETATITINSQEPVANGAINVTSNGGLTFESVTGGTVNGTLVAFARAENVTSGIATYKFKTPTVTKDTTYKVVFASQDMENAEGNAIASSTATATVTVKAKQNNNTTGGGSTGGNAGGNTTPTEPKFTEVNVRKSWSTSSGIIGSLGAGKSVTRIGKGDNGWSKVSFNGSTGYIYSEYLTTTQPKAEEQKPKEQPKNEEKSTNKNLAKLEVKPEGLTPEFKKDVTDYTIKVPNSIEKLDIIAEAEDSKSKVEISGNDKLVEGDNIVKILVTAEDGTTRTYIITATREKTVQSSLRLSALTIEGINIEPAFSPDIFAYTAILSNSEINELKVNATTSDENTTIEILGNSNLQDGENVITILLKSTKTDETTTYQITVNKPVQQAEKQGILPKLSAKEIFYIIAGIISLIILLLIIKRDKLNASKKNKEEKATNNGEYEQNKNEYLDQYETKEKIENNNFEETNEDPNDDLKKKKGKHF